MHGTLSKNPTNEFYPRHVCYQFQYLNGVPARGRQEEPNMMKKASTITKCAAANDDINISSQETGHLSKRVIESC